MLLVESTSKGPSHAHCPVPKSIPPNAPSRGPGQPGGGGVSKFTVVVTWASVSSPGSQRKKPSKAPAISADSGRGQKGQDSRDEADCSPVRTSLLLRDGRLREAQTFTDRETAPGGTKGVIPIGVLQRQKYLELRREKPCEGVARFARYPPPPRHQRGLSHRRDFRTP